MSADLVFWQGGLSIHQAPLISALSNMGIQTTIVVPATLSDRRRQMGWGQPSFDETVVKILSSTEESVEVARRHKAAIHVMSGIGYKSHIQQAFWTLAKDGESRIAVMSESWDPRGVKGAGRFLKYKLMMGRMKPYIDMVFTNGALAAKQYRSIGVSGRKIRPFGYFVDSLSKLPTASNKEFKLVFVGRLIGLKNVKLLLRALSHISGSWSLTVIGDGPQRDELQEQVERDRLTQRISFLGTVRNEVVHRCIANSDLLVLPSKYDGWGAVVNEALMNGTPAVVSSACGASELITGPVQGDVFPSRDLQTLTAVLRQRISSGPLSLRERIKLTEWATVSISPEASAKYLWDSLATSTPLTPPWRKRDE